MDALYQPSGTGFDALNELDQVDWSQLEHAYGRGHVPLGSAYDVSFALTGDVPRSLAALRTDPFLALSDGLYSNICHQGTVYEATVHAVPFIAAVAAGDVSHEIRIPLLALLGHISVGGSYITHRGSRGGALGDQIGVLVTESIASSMARLSTIQTARLVDLIQAIQSLLIHPTDACRDAVESAVDVAIAPPATPQGRRP
ncbi:hypothetical protein [Arthrobacter sp. B0490]|uniref:hypothetical protein n=1 Tax=Arthrobacter sp. B0490 TaxID=2058891 RepID=UPI0011AFF042|nr:hypothetical protein [Arthrobacter sp. B0490]